MSLNEMMPREKAINFGISSLSNVELLALVIKTGNKDASVFKLAEDVINLGNGFNNLLSLSYEELTSLKGIKKAKALEIMAILEISKRLTRIDQINEDLMLEPSKIIKWLRFNVGFDVQEKFFVVFLNGRGVIIKAEVMYQGNRHASIVGVDEILRKAILLKASGIIVAHNHPSGNVKPSNADIDLTKKLYSSCQMVGIPLLDHIIIGTSEYFSFKNHDMLQ